MQLEKVTAEIRPRGRWESIDLGCALVRENYGRVMAAWALTVLPLWFAIICLSQLWPWAEGRPWMALILSLWSLPLCDRVPLFVLSRRLFGEEPRAREVLRAFPGMLLKRIFPWVILGPFAMNRALAQPVAQLEGLKGKEYSNRVQLLSRNGGEGAVQACMISFVLVLATMFSLMFMYFAFLGLFGDSVVLENFWVKHVLESDAAWIPVPYVWVIYGLTMLAVTLMEPFYVGAGFAMYINSRTVTEGWDIELAFKRMNERIERSSQSLGQRVGLGILLAFLCGGQFCDLQASDARLEEVMASEEFVIHTETEEVPVSSGGSNVSDEGSSFLSPFIQAIGNILFWLVIIAALGGIIWLIVSNLHTIRGGGRVPLSSQPPKIKTLMGMDVTPESLPDDIAAAALQAWRDGKSHLALSLLYRGSISWLVNQGDLEIGEGDTELDCVRSVRAAGHDEVTGYFDSLTREWTRLAYGKQEPEADQVKWLCSAWPFRSGLQLRKEAV